MTHAGLLAFHCLTPLHNGAGQGLGSVDRPIVREVATRYPYVQSSTLKGALRAAARSHLQRQRDEATSATEEPTTAPTGSIAGAPPETAEPPADPLAPVKEDPVLLALFGKGESDGNLGALTLTDSSVLLFPVRSLCGTMAWATSPFALANFHRLRALAAPAADRLLAATAEVLDIPLGSSGSACGGEGTGADTWNDAEVRIDGKGDYVVEGLILRARPQAADRRKVGTLAEALAAYLYPEGGFWPRFFCPRLLLLGNDDLTHLVHHATQIEANIQIDETGVTTDGSLRYTEFLPAETVLYSFFQVLEPGRQVTPAAARQLFEHAAGDLRQLGGDESKGKGLVRTLLDRPPVPQPGAGADHV